MKNCYKNNLNELNCNKKFIFLTISENLRLKLKKVNPPENLSFQYNNLLFCVHD
jgi:hypothetical protein